MNDLNQPPLGEVLDMLLESHDAPTQDAVALYSERFPAYRADIVGFAAAWALERHLPVPPGLTPEQEAQVLSRAQSFLESQLYARSPGASAATTLMGLLRAADRAPSELAATVGMNTALVMRLNNRLVRAETIPQRIASAIADFIGVDVAGVVRSWSPSPRLAASFLPQREAPSFQQDDFATAVRGSGLPMEAVERLLAD